MIGYVKYSPKHKAHFTNVADQLDVMFKVMGANVPSPNAQYPALPKTTMNKEMTVNVPINKCGKLSGFLQEALRLRMSPTPSML